MKGVIILLRELGVGNWLFCFFFVLFFCFFVFCFFAFLFFFFMLYYLSNRYMDTYVKFWKKESMDEVH
jgi:hypothetical protein